MPEAKSPFSSYMGISPVSNVPLRVSNDGTLKTLPTSKLGRFSCFIQAYCIPRWLMPATSKEYRNAIKNFRSVSYQRYGKYTGEDLPMGETQSKSKSIANGEQISGVLDATFKKSRFLTGEVVEKIEKRGAAMIRERYTNNDEVKDAVYRIVKETFLTAENTELPKENMEKGDEIFQSPEQQKNVMEGYNKTMKILSQCIPYKEIEINQYHQLAVDVMTLHFLKYGRDSTDPLEAIESRLQSIENETGKILPIQEAIEKIHLPSITGKQIFAQNKPPETNAQNKPPETNVQNKPPETNVQNKPLETNVQNKPPETNAQNKPPETNVQSKPPETNVQSKPPETNAKGLPQELEEPQEGERILQKNRDKEIPKEMPFEEQHMVQETKKKSSLTKSASVANLSFSPSPIKPANSFLRIPGSFTGSTKDLQAMGVSSSRSLSSLSSVSQKTKPPVNEKKGKKSAHGKNKEGEVFQGKDQEALSEGWFETLKDEANKASLHKYASTTNLQIPSSESSADLRPKLSSSQSFSSYASLATQKLSPIESKGIPNNLRKAFTEKEQPYAEKIYKSLVSHRDEKAFLMFTSTEEENFISVVKDLIKIRDNYEEEYFPIAERALEGMFISYAGKEQGAILEVMAKGMPVLDKSLRFLNDVEYSVEKNYDGIPYFKSFFRDLIVETFPQSVKIEPKEDIANYMQSNFNIAKNFSEIGQEQIKEFIKNYKNENISMHNNMEIHEARYRILQSFPQSAECQTALSNLEKSLKMQISLLNPSDKMLKRHESILSPTSGEKEDHALNKIIRIFQWSDRMNEAIIKKQIKKQIKKANKSKTLKILKKPFSSDSKQKSKKVKGKS